MYQLDFSWVKKGVIGGMSHPDRFGGAKVKLTELSKRFGIRSILTLSEETFEMPSLKRIHFETYHVPIPNLGVPVKAQFEDLCRIFKQAARPMAVHCMAGIGRTGMIMAFFLVFEGTAAQAAIDQVIDRRMTSFETNEQEAAVFEFETFCRTAPDSLLK